MLSGVFLNLISSPKNIIIVTLSTLLIFSGMNGYKKNNKIEALKNQVEKVNIELERCVSVREIEREIYNKNINTLKNEIGEFQELTNEWKILIDNKNAQITKEQERVNYWKKQYQDKLCVNNDMEMVKPTDMVINDQANEKVVDKINVLFGVDK